MVVDLEAFAQSGGMEEEDEPCEICASAVQSAESPLLECDRCLRGYHTDCLNLPLEDIPEVKLHARNCDIICLHFRWIRRTIEYIGFSTGFDIPESKMPPSRHHTRGHAAAWYRGSITYRKNGFCSPKKHKKWGTWYEG